MLYLLFLIVQCSSWYISGQINWATREKTIWFPSSLLFCLCFCWHRLLTPNPNAIGPEVIAKYPLRPMKTGRSNALLHGFLACLPTNVTERKYLAQSQEALIARIRTSHIYLVCKAEAIVATINPKQPLACRAAIAAFAFQMARSNSGSVAASLLIIPRVSTHAIVTMMVLNAMERWSCAKITTVRNALIQTTPYHLASREVEIVEDILNTTTENRIKNPNK